MPSSCRRSPGFYWVGTGGCLYSWPGAELGASTRFRLGAFDLTGAFSGWSESIDLTIPDQYEEPELQPGTAVSPEPQRAAGESADDGAPRLAHPPHVTRANSERRAEVTLGVRSLEARPPKKSVSCRRATGSTRSQRHVASRYSLVVARW